MSDNEAAYETLKVALKPRCNIATTTKELKANNDIGSVEISIYKNFLDQAVESEVAALFDALGHMDSLKKLTLTSRGSATQVVPAHLLAQTLADAEGLQELYLTHIKIAGHTVEIEDLAASFGEHTELRVLELHVENADHLQACIAAAGHIPSLESVAIETAQAPRKTGELASALESLSTSKSLKTLKLVNLAQRYDDFSEMTRLLGINHVLEELTIKVTELDLDGGKSIVNMLLAGPALKKLVLEMDTMDKSLTPEFVKALDHNPNIEYFQLMMDARVSDMKVARSMVVSFRDGLKGKFKSTSKVGLQLGVIVERIASD